MKILLNLVLKPATIGNTFIIIHVVILACLNEAIGVHSVALICYPSLCIAFSGASQLFKGWSRTQNLPFYQRAAASSAVAVTWGVMIGECRGMHASNN